MFKVLGDDGGFEEVGVFDEEGEAVGGPGGDLGGTGVDHAVCFCQWDEDISLVSHKSCGMV